MDKVIGLQEAISKVKQGDTLMIGGFGGFGFPSNLVWEVARQNIGELTVIAEDFGNGYSPFEMNIPGSVNCLALIRILSLYTSIYCPIE